MMNDGSAGDDAVDGRVIAASLPMGRNAFACIVYAGRIVLLYHPDHPEAGIQLPAGSMEAGEMPEDAMLREAFKETGLAGLADRPLPRRDRA